MVSKKDLKVRAELKSALFWDKVFAQLEQMILFNLNQFAVHTTARQLCLKLSQLRVFVSAVSETGFHMQMQVCERDT